MTHQWRLLIRGDREAKHVCERCGCYRYSKMTSEGHRAKYITYTDTYTSAPPCRMVTDPA